MKVNYPTVDDLVKIVRKKGKGSKIFVRDLSKAYRQMWHEPGQVHLLGYVFENRYYYGVCLSMDGASSAYCCQRSTDIITYLFKQHGYDDINYLDDLGGAETVELADQAFHCLGWIMERIGVKEAQNKAIAPSVMVVFLGILFNTMSMTLQITRERLTEIQTILKEWLKKDFASLRELQSLLRKLNFASSTARSGRIFVSRLINELKTYNGDDQHRKRVSAETKQDIRWWHKFMESFDGITIMPPSNWRAPETVFSTDSCLTACGGWFENTAFQCKFPKWIMDNGNISINEKEMIAVLIAVRKWGNHIENLNILAYCDNQATCEIINRGQQKTSLPSNVCVNYASYLRSIMQS